MDTFFLCAQPFHTIIQPSSDDPSHPRGGLFLGSLLSVTQAAAPLLRSHNITVLVQVIEEPCLSDIDPKARQLTRLHIDLPDSADRVLDAEFLNEVTAYIEEKMQRGENVLVHCFQASDISFLCPSSQYDDI